MKYFLWIMMLLFLSSHLSIAANKRVKLIPAMNDKLISFKVNRTDKAYHEKGLRLIISNHSKEALVIQVDPALLFEAEDSNYQDLVLPGSELLYVGAGKSNEIEVQTFCAKSKAMAPPKEMAFTFKKQCDSNLIKTFAYLNQISANNDLSQQAVWLLTDKEKDLSSVYDSEQKEQSRQLMLFLSKLLNIPIPNYHTERNINTTPGVMAQSGPVLKLHVKIAWEQASPQTLSLSIFDEQNRRIASYFEDKYVRRGRGEIIASFETADYPKGTYYVRLYNDIGNVIKEEKVALE